MRLKIVFPVWGTYFRKLLQTVVLPAHLSPGNLPAIHRDLEVEYRVYAPKADQEALATEGAALLRRLGDFAAITFIPIPDEVSFSYKPETERETRTKNIRAMDAYDQNKFSLQSYCYVDTIGAAGSDGDTAVLCATADVVHADGALGHIAKLLGMGKRAICAASFDMLDRSAIAQIEANHGVPGEPSLVIPARDLVRLALDHMHPSAAGYLVDSDSYPAWRHNLLWRVDEDGLLGRWFSVHPLVIAPTRERPMEVYEQLDGSYLFDVVPDADQIHVVEDSDDLCMMGLARESYYYGRPSQPNRFDPATMADILYRLKHGGIFHRYPEIDVFARHSLKFHAGPLTPAWDPVIAESDRVVAEVLAAYQAIEARGDEHRD